MFSSHCAGRCSPLKVMTFTLWPGRFRARPFSYLRRESADQTGEALALHLDVDPFTGSGPGRRRLEYFALEPQARFPRYSILT
ncbi:hypothetical protein [Mesorhizobium sp. CA16]|uniref:hypothetical protein n=1 Tax=Mesorhizobium sp. CA16 TaxID=588496 RepID=UPI001CCD77EC|nr:hypothetical protein [Mesorhizobium sp. CA16]MBZ9912179.1 hypothetical protein [Mesorhizobium sp. CA16]